MALIQGVLVGLLLLASSLCWGGLARAWLPKDAGLCHRWGAGLALLASAIGLCAAVGWLYPLPLFLLLAVPLAWGGREAARVVEGELAELRALTQVPGGRACLALLLLFWVGAGVGALAPNTHWDVEMYHYTLPRLYLSEHRLYWTGTSLYDGVFQFTHLLYLPALRLGGEVAANLFGTGMLVLLCMSSAAAARTQESEPSLAPLLTMLLVCSSPIVFLQGYGGLMDVPAALWCMLALDAWLRSRRDRLWTKWLALWCGLAVATKVTAGMSVLSLGLGILLTREDWKQKARAWGLTVVVVALVCSPWLARNWLAQRAPLYPLGRHEKPASASRPRPASTSLPRAGPWVNPASFGPSLLRLNWRERDWQQAFNPCLITGLLLACPASNWLPGLITVLLATLCGVTDHRYAMGGYLWLAIPSARGLAGFLRSHPGPVRLALGASWLFSLLCLGGSLALRLPVIVGQESQADYLAAIDPLHAAYDFLAGQVQRPGDQIWLMDPRGYRCPIPFVVMDHGSGPQSWDNLPWPPRWILWNFSRPLVAPQLAYWTLRELGPGPHSRASLGILGRLPDKLLDRALRKNGAVLMADGFRQEKIPDWPIPLDQKVARATWEGTVVYDQGLIIIVELPTASR